MNIAIVLIQSFDPNAGGVQRSTSKLAQIFKSHSHHVIIICWNQKENNQSFWNDIPIYREDNKKRLASILKDNNIEILLNQIGYSYKLTKTLKRVSRNQIRLINTLRINPLNFYDNHELFVTNYLSRRNLGFLKSKLLFKLILTYHVIKQNIELTYIVKNVDAFVMLSTNFIPELFRLVPGVSKYKHKIYGIGNPFEQPGINLSDIKKENIILFVGRLNKLQKRVDLLAEIWKRLHHQFPDWRFWVVGDGEDRAYMEKFCQSNSLNRVQFFGKDKPDDYYKKAKIFHMTSAFEGFGNVLVEAQSYGCVPILFNSYSAAMDIVKDKENGILISPFDVNSFIEETIRLIKTPDLIDRLASNAATDSKKFSYDAISSKWFSLFENIKQH